MKISHRWGLMVLALLMLISPKPAFAAFECNDNGWEGTSELLSVARSVAGIARVKLIAELDYSVLTPEDAILFIHPEVSLDEVSLMAFIQQGGRAAVLDDFGRSTSFIERYGIRRVPGPGDPELSLRGNRNLSVGTPVEAVGADGSLQRHPAFRDVDRIVLNHPTGLTNPNLTSLFEVRTKNGAATPIAVSGVVVGATPPGRLLVMSDPSAIINLMIRYPGNLAFARDLIQYLVDDDGRTNGGRLFIVTNRFQQTGRFAKRQGVSGDLADAFERLTHELRNGIPATMLIVLAIVAALGTARWIVAHAWNRSLRSIPRFLRPVPLASQAGWPGRAAMLVAPTTHPALLMVELREAFRARLAQLTGADCGATSRTILELVESRNLLPPNLLVALRNVLAEVDAAERAVVARRPLRIRKPTLQRLLHQSLDILEHLAQLERSHRESRLTSQ